MYYESLIMLFARLLSSLSCFAGVNFHFNTSHNYILKWKFITLKLSGDSCKQSLAFALVTTNI